MRERVRLSDEVDLILTQDEHGYADVLNDARDRGGDLFIVAYAVTIKGDSMLQLLRDGIPGVGRIEFITGIPRFHQREWVSPKWRAEAKAQIKEYLLALHPRRIHASVSAAIVTRNHAKLAISDRVAYVGSANFSDDSADKKEAGVLIRNPAHCQQIRNRYKTIFAGDIYRYNPDVTSLIGVRAALDEAADIFSTLLADIEEHSDPETGVIAIARDQVDVVRKWVSTAADALALALEVVGGDDLEEAKIERPRVLEEEHVSADLDALYDDRVDAFLSFNSSTFVEQRVEELTTSNPELLDAASEQANNEAEEELAERFDAAWAVIEPVLGRVPPLGEALNAISDQVSQSLKDLRYLVLG